MNYSILVNTCDKFEDCWEPFFKLWSIYWTDCKGKIFLNTEYKDFSYSDLNIISTKSCVGKGYKGKYATWSQCLRWALEKIDTDIILYMQEDYFLKDYVKNDIVEKFVELMLNDTNIKCLHLTDQAVIANESSKYENLCVVNRYQRYRISCQAALWRKDELLMLINNHESAWEFEEFGSKRSSYIGNEYLSVDKNWIKLNKFEIIPYIFTGIVQGSWKEEVVPLFKKHGIVVDFSVRGFLGEKSQKALHKRVKNRVRRCLSRIRNEFLILNMKKTR